MYRKPIHERPRVAAIIPARGGSTRLPGKNLRRLQGKPLVEHAIDAARYCDDIYVSTDDNEIAAVARANGAEVVKRPASISTATSTTESAIAHWLSTLAEMDKPEVIVLLQPSTPMRDGAAWVWRAIDDFVLARVDSMVAVQEYSHLAFAGTITADPETELPMWRTDRDIMSRPRTQDVKGRAYECGAFWLFTRAHFEATGCRQGGACMALAMPRWSYVDIDTLEDLKAAESLLAKWQRG